MNNDKSKTTTGTIRAKQRKGGWTTQTNTCIRSPFLSPIQGRLYSVLASYCGYETVMPSVSTLRANCGRISKNTLLKCIKELEELNLLEVVRGRVREDGGFTSNEYIIDLDYDIWEKQYKRKLKNSTAPLLDLIEDEDEGSE